MKTSAPAALAAALAALISSAAFADGFPAFQHVEIDPHAGDVVYAVTLADVDGDEKQDIVAVTENRVLWYENPSWTRHVIIADQSERDNVCIAPLDIDGDGKVDFALGAGWTKVGTVQWLSRGDSLKEKWNVHMIGRERWLHRMRFADVLGKGRPQLVISPLNATVGNGVRLTAFTIPENPRTDRWPRTVLADTLNRMHNHWHVDFDKDGLVDTITASREGIYFITKSDNGFTKRKLADGAPGENGQQPGAGEIKVGQLANGSPFLATVEPMHGNMVVVYTAHNLPAEAGAIWDRHVLDDTLKQGHAVWPANLDEDGDDELVIGHREAGPGPVKGPGLYIYDAQNKAGTKWQKHVVDDGGMATEDAIAADLTGDGRVDIVAGGRATHNIKLYVNQGNAE